MAKPKTPEFESFDQITGRLDEIVQAVRNKDTSLEHSLDLFDEALSLGAAAVELVDSTNFTPEEEAQLANLSVGKSLDADGAKGDEVSAGDGDGSTAQA